MPHDNEVRWLLVGTGDIAKKRVAPALAMARPGKLVAVCDLVPERARDIASSFGADEVFTDFDAALATTSANAVYIATPVDLHAAQAALAMEAGKHVLVEKPLGCNLADTERAIRAASRSGLRAGCAYFRRCSPRYRQAQEMLRRNEFGHIVLVRMTYFSWFSPDKDDPKHWRVVKSRSGGGPLSDIACHMFDVLIGLLGMPRNVYAKTKTQVHDHDVEDSATILMDLPDGGDLVASFHWNSKTWSHEFEIVGTEAKLKWHPFDSGPVIKTVGRDIHELDLPNPDNVHLPLVEDFVEAVVGGRDPVVPLREASRTNRLLDAVYRSAATGDQVTLQEGQDK